MSRHLRLSRKGLRKLGGFVLLSVALAAKIAFAQAAFDVASIRSSGARVQFERNGKTEVSHGTLTMRDVTVSSCIQWAYAVPQALINGPKSLEAARYDVTAKTSPDATKEQMRWMLRTLLSERFKLSFHRENRELKVYSLTVAKGGLKMKPSKPGGEMFRENSATGMVMRSITMQALADYLSDPLGAPLTDGTGLAGRFDGTIDFTPYVDMERSDVNADPAAVLKAALKGELGLEMVQRKETVEVMVVDRVEAASAN